MYFLLTSTRITRWAQAANSFLDSWSLSGFGEITDVAGQNMDFNSFLSNNYRFLKFNSLFNGKVLLPDPKVECFLKV